MRRSLNHMCCAPLLLSCVSSGISLSTNIPVDISCKVGVGANSKPAWVGIRFVLRSGIHNGNTWSPLLKCYVVVSRMFLCGQDILLIFLKGRCLIGHIPCSLRHYSGNSTQNCAGRVRSLYGWNREQRAVRVLLSNLPLCNFSLHLPYSLYGRFCLTSLVMKRLCWHV